LYLLKATVVGTIAQRLVRVLCPHCNRSTDINDEAEGPQTSPWKVDLPENAAQADGCLECRETGFVGREGIYEVLPITESLFRFSADEADLPRLWRQA